MGHSHGQARSPGFSRGPLKISLPPNFTIKSATYSMGRNISNGCQPLEGMIWWGLSTIWTRCVVASRFLTPRSGCCRLLIISTLQVPLSGSVSANSGTYAAAERYCHLRIHYRLKISRSVVSLSPRGVLAMCTKGGSTVRRFVSNVTGSTPRMVLGRPQRYTFYPTTSLPTSLTGLADLLPGGCGVETLGTPKYCPPLRYYLHSTSAYLAMDARRRPDGICQETPWRRPARSCKYPCRRILSHADSATSYLMSLKIFTFSTLTT